MDLHTGCIQFWIFQSIKRCNKYIDLMIFNKINIIKFQNSKMKHQTKNSDNYFKKLLQNLQTINQKNGHEETSYNQTLQISLRCIQQTAFDILAGEIQFKQQPDSIASIIKLPSHKKMDEHIDQIDKKIRQNEQMLRQAKRELLIQRKQSQETLKLQNQIKKRQNQLKIKNWSQKQKQLNQKRKSFVQKRQRQIQIEEQKQKQQKQRFKEQQIQRRRKSLQKKHRQMQQQRQKRQQLFQQSIQDTKRIKLPKFKIIQKQFQKVLEQQNFQKQIIKKNIKLSSQLDHNVIKQHEKNYMQKVLQRMKAKGQSSQRTLNQQQKNVYQSRFKTLLKRSQQQIQAQKQRYKRRINFQQRLKQLQVNVDQDKRLKIAIALDKAQNPFKYNFLRQKQLNQYQIYMEFKDFALDIDRTELGNSYLQQSKRIGEQSRIKKSHSISAISLKNRYQKQEKYKNYLLELKANRSVYNLQKNSTEAILAGLNKQTSKQKAIDKISRNLNKFDDQIKNRKYELKTFNTITTTMKKQREIDQMYMKSIKAKLACLQIQ